MTWREGAAGAGDQPPGQRASAEEWGWVREANEGVLLLVPVCGAVDSGTHR